MSDDDTRLTKEEKAANLVYQVTKGKKLSRRVKRRMAHALKARGLREKTMVGNAFEKGIQFGFRLHKAKIQKATENLTYE